MMVLWGYNHWGVHFDGKDVGFRHDAVYTILPMSKESKNRKQ
jgi:hypothetical protein